jgi:eukaryotic-like serine/threonine-protein kinase
LTCLFALTTILIPVLLMIGQTLSHYRISGQLGAGGMGVVYLAHDERLERDVAVKVLLPGTLTDEAIRQRFRREALTLSKLNHPNIAMIFDFDSEADTDFLVTEYVSGPQLDTRLVDGPLGFPELLRLGIQLAEGLAAAHASGIVHRDLKPANLRLTSEGRLKILDFGLAQLVHPNLDVARTMSHTSTSQQITGTLPYMAPEQLRGEPLDARSDIWAAGAVLYELATGKRPFAETNGAMLIDAILNRNPESLSKLNREISPSIESIILKALEKDPSRRYQTSKELAEDLERLTANVSPNVATARRKAWWTAASVLVLFVALTLGWPFLGRHTRQATPLVVPPARHSVAVLGFKNLAGRPDTAWLSTALSEMLTTELAAGENLLTISGENVARVKTDLSLPEQDTLAADTLARVHQNLGSDFVVLGSYLELGTESNESIRVDLRLQDAKAGQTIALVSEKGTLAELDGVVTRAGAQLRNKLGVRSVPIEEELTVKATLPSNLKASRLYSEGLAKLRNYDVLGARDLLLKAVAEDPKHVPSLVALSAAWGSLGYDSKSLETAAKAYDLSASLPRAEKLRVEGQYLEQSSQWDKAIAAYKELFTNAPDNLDYGLKLVSAQFASGKAPDALSTIARLRGLPAPQHDDLRIDLAESRAANITADFKRQLALGEAVAERGKQQGARLLVARALLEQCSAKRNLGDLKAAVMVCRQAQQLATDAGDRFVAAQAMNSAGNALYDQGDAGEARRMYENAVRVYREIGNVHGLAGTLDNIASIMGDQGDHEGARKFSEQSLAIYRETGFLVGVAETLNNIGAELITQGDLIAAQKRFDEALKIWRQMSNDSGIAIVLTNLGELRLQLADVTGAKSAYAEALAIFVKGGEKSKSVYPQLGLADVLLASGDLKEAKKNYSEGMATAREVDDKHELAFALAGRGEVAFEEGDLQNARKHMGEALSLRSELGEKDAVLSSTVQLARVDIEEGKFTEAEAQTRKSLPGKKSEDVGGDAALAHAALAEALLEQNRVREAQHESAISRKLAGSTQLRQVQWQTRIVQAKVEAAAGNFGPAVSSLQDAIQQAEKLGLLRIGMNARLAVWQVEIKANKSARRAHLQALESEARSRGFVRIADKAREM